MPAITPPRSEENYLDPATLSKISSLGLFARMVVEGLVSGLHKSSYHGFSVEFSEHRPYNPGDDIRYIDWKALAKLDRFYIKKFEEETNLRSYVILDSSGSMGFRSGSPLSKLDYGKFLTVCLAYLMLVQRDSVGLSLFAESARRFIPPRANRDHIQVLVDELRDTRAEGKSSIAGALSDLAGRISRRGLVVVISDLLDDQQRVLEALRHTRHRKNEIIIFHLLDPHEIEIPWKGYLKLVDMEDPETLTTDPGRLSRDYRQRVESFVEGYRQGCLGENIDYVLVSTDRPLDEVLPAYLASRKRKH